jgi:malate dehydrogenase (oxaloacetate-decarboxylating)(NADP+)
MIRKEDALSYHSQGRKGKIEVVATKPCVTQRDLGLAYTPGVAEPCMEISNDAAKVYDYTAKGNLVAVVSNGTAVLGLGNIGPEAGKPVMEGKGVLFKKFADIDVFDIELESKDADDLINTVKSLAPTFGGINLEDIKAPECFYIEEKLKEITNIPVMHDDQHGTAIISGAALLNALEIIGKRIEDINVTVCGTGAAGIACANFYITLGVKPSNLIMVDIEGVIYKGRTKGMDKYMERLAVETDKRTLADSFDGADVFLGVSAGNIVSKEMVKKMAPDPIIFAMANPIPEISYEDVKEVRPDAIVGTGRSDYPNQINNVLGFPFIFRGALDVRASAINDEMKKAAAESLARLAKQDVPDSVIRAYGGKPIHFGRDYIIPKPFDPRVLIWESMAVAKAAVDSGVAQKPIEDWDAYRNELEGRLGHSYEVMRWVFTKAQSKYKRIVFPEGENLQILRAVQIIIDEKIAQPILIGSNEKIKQIAKENDIHLNDTEIIEPENYKMLPEYINDLHQLRNRKGVTRTVAERLLKNDRNYLGAMMVRKGAADCMLSGVTRYYPDVIRPALQILEAEWNNKIVAGLHMMIFKNELLFFADTTVNIDPDAETLAQIAILAADEVKTFDIEPKVAMLSFGNFGSVRNSKTKKIAEAVQIVKAKRPDIEIDGEMQVDTAFDLEQQEKYFDFSALKGRANVLIFPALESANIAYKLMTHLGGAEAVGPILLGLKKSVHVLQRNSDVETIVRMSAIAAINSEEK